MKIGVVGLGKLGVPMAALFAQAGHQVVGVDVIDEKIEMINRHENPIPAEPNVFIPHNMSATKDYDAIKDCDLIFVAVNTPPTEQGNLRLVDLEMACWTLRDVLKDRDEAIVVISSTVPPKTMEYLAELVNPLGRNAIVGIQMVYNPFFIALGQVVNDLQYPNIILIGADNPRAGAIVAGLWSDITGGQIPISTVNLRTAELVKFGLTPYLVMRINWANSIARVAEEIGEIDAQQVIDIIGQDRRINTRELKIGLPWGGDCYPKDVNAFLFFCNSEGINPGFFEGLVEVNQDWARALPTIIKDKVCRTDFRKAKVAFLGISYKKTYPLLNMSTPYKLYEHFVKEEEADVAVHDPYIETLPDGTKTQPLEECLKDAELVIVAVAYPLYRKLKPEDLPYKETPVVDLCRGLDGSDISMSENWLLLGYRD